MYWIFQCAELSYITFWIFTLETQIWRSYNKNVYVYFMTAKLCSFLSKEYWLWMYETFVEKNTWNKTKRFWRKRMTFEIIDVRNIAHHLVLKTAINYKAQHFGSWIGRILKPKIQSKLIHCGPISKFVL